MRNNRAQHDLIIQTKPYKAILRKISDNIEIISNDNLVASWVGIGRMHRGGRDPSLKKKVVYPEFFAYLQKNF